MVTFTLPTSRRITQEWGQDFNWLNGKHYPNGFYSSIGWLGHNGIDYGCPVGDPVESVCDGVVEYVGPGNNHPLLSGGGNTVLVRNDELGIRFEYLHLSQQNVYTGQRVKCGQVIALSGNTGTSTAPHLHVGAIPMRPNLNNGYRGRVDLTGWLYGPSNPDYAGGLAAQGNITELTPASEEDDMPLSREDVDNIAARVVEVMQPVEDVTRQYLADRTRDAAVAILSGTQAQEDVTRLYVADQTQAQQDVTRQYLADRIKDASPADLAVQINAAGIAAEVRDELVKLLSK